MHPVNVDPTTMPIARCLDSRKRGNMLHGMPRPGVTSNVGEHVTEKQKHAPGPWRVVRFEHHKPGERPLSHIERDDDDGERSRLTLHIDDVLADEVALKLNSHADLLAACKAALEYAEATVSINDNDDHNDLRLLVVAIRAAIARAERAS